TIRPDARFWEWPSCCSSSAGSPFAESWTSRSDAVLLLATILFAVAFGTGLLAVYQILVRDRDPVVARLRDLRARTVAARPEVKKERAWTLADALATLGGFLPTRESDESLRSGLERAGIRAPRAELVFLGTKVFLAFTSGLAWVTISYALARPMGSILLQGGIAVVVGFYFPTFWLYRKGEARKAQIQAEKLGASIAQSLRAHAESMRTKRRQRAEQAARKAGIKLAFPLVFMIFPALLIVILGPAAIQLMQALAAQSTH